MIFFATVTGFCCKRHFFESITIASLRLFCCLFVSCPWIEIKTKKKNRNVANPAPRGWQIFRSHNEIEHDSATEFLKQDNDFLCVNYIMKLHFNRIFI